MKFYLTFKIVEQFAITEVDASLLQGTAATTITTTSLTPVNNIAEVIA